MSTHAPNTLLCINRATQLANDTNEARQPTFDVRGIRRVLQRLGLDRTSKTKLHIKIIFEHAVETHGCLLDLNSTCFSKTKRNAFCKTTLKICEMSQH